MENKHLLKNATSFKKYWHILLMVLAGILISQSSFAWGYKSQGGNNWGDCTSSFTNTTFYPTGNGTTTTLDVIIKTNQGSGFNVTQNNGCDGQQLYVGISSTTNSADITRATARWNSGLYSEYTIVIPQGKVYLTPAGGSAVEMSKSGNEYTGTVDFGATKTYTITGGTVTTNAIQANNSMPSGGRPSSVTLNLTAGPTHTYDRATIKYNLQTNQITIVSGVNKPTITTPTSASVAATSATLGANVTNDGGGTVSARGTVWGTTASPTGNSSSQGTGTGAFTHSRTGLTANTLYYYRGYATNAAGTSYTSDGTFTTLPDAPTVGSGSGATGNSFTANWLHPTQGTASYTYEVQVSTDNSTWASPINVTGIASNNTSASITGLAAGTTYYYRVLARNATGAGAWSAPSAAIATTSSYTAPSITSSAATSVSSGTGTMNGNISSNGGASIDDYGFYYSTESGFADGDGTQVQVGTSNHTGDFSSVLSGKTNGTTYYYKAYATNSVGTTYGSQQSFTPCSAPVSYAQSVTITACGSKTIDLTAGLTGSIPEDAGTVTYTVSPEGDGLTIISGSTAEFSATANKTYTITISFSNAAYCSVSGTLSVTYTNNTPSISLTNTKTGKSASATYPYEAFVLTATTDNTPVTWTLTQPSGVTDGTLTISADTKTATFVGGTSNASPYTIEAATVAVGSCSAASVEYDVYVDAPEAENCTAPTNCTPTWAYQFETNANDEVKWGSKTDFTCTGNGVWTRTFELLGSKWNWGFKIWHSSNSGGSYTEIYHTFQSKGITEYYDGRKTWTIVLTEGASAGVYTVVILAGDQTSTGGSTPTNPTVLRGAAASVNSGTSEATLYGYLKFAGCSTITAYGFQYANNASFTGATSVTTTGPLTAASTYNKTVSGLSDGTYYYRAYATNSAGTDYSDSATFVIANLKPALTTTAATSIGKTSGTMNGNISSNGGSSITDYGFYYSTTNGFADGTGTKVQVGTSDYTGNV